MAARPDILLIIADDVARNHLGAYGSTHGLTPAIDSIGAGGLTFTNAFTTSPLCTPSRFSILTGRYASTGEASSESMERAARAQWPREVAFHQHVSHMGTDWTLPRMLRTAGYATAFMGKYHAGGPPACRGIAGWNASGACGRTADHQACAAAEIEHAVGFETAEDVYYDNEAMTRFAHEPEFMGLRGAVLVERARREKRPFFLYFAPTLTHSPEAYNKMLKRMPRMAPGDCASATAAGPAAAAPASAAAAKLRERAALRLIDANLLCRDTGGGETGGADTGGGLSWCKGTGRVPAPPSLLHPEGWFPDEWLRDRNGSHSWASFAAGGMRAPPIKSVAGLAWLDVSLEPLLAAARAGPRGDDTLIIFTTDHAPYFSGKGAPYEDGIRLPFLLQWPGRLGLSPRRLDHTVTLLDLLPTLAQVASADLRSASAQQTHGHSFASLLHPAGKPGLAPAGSVKAEGVESHRRDFVIEVGYTRSLRSTDGWKLIVNFPPANASGAARHAGRRLRSGGVASGGVWGGVAGPVAAGDACRTFYGIGVARSYLETDPKVGKGSKGLQFMYDAWARHRATYCDPVQLYDLGKDPAEQTNLALAEPARVAELRRRLDEHIEGVEHWREGQGRRRSRRRR